MTTIDWDLINHGLAMLEAVYEDDTYDGDRPESELMRLKACRAKVFRKIIGGGEGPPSPTA